ncbi:trypsin-like peptidase domain-containing protein [Laribacter hongkongensis]|uniref:trypsin-like peptidase domain-containing protein n=1 Tax=Laribacter hongkongensis TaxID=168471 RepID=UPI001EFE22F5|nr:trypsin-like peptidase domain-containing protein [Laribacter hongkongensis]MCG9066263.1 trypsin-like peptidase domain-containing protein [Laribacter hongkongensis]
MCAIKTAGELGVELGEHCQGVAQKMYKEAIRPIYCSTENGRPVHEGSCVLLNLEGKHILLTAAHVMDANKEKNSTIYVGGEKNLLKIEGEFLVSEKKEENRLKDRYDFAALLLSNEDVINLGDVCYIRENEIAPDREKHNGRLYSIIGYPNTKNKSVDCVNYSVKSARWHYFSTHRDNAGLCKKLGITGEKHIFVSYDKKSKSSNGEIVNSISPRGVSGGAVFDLGNFGDPASYALDAVCKPLLAGIFIEFHHEHHATVATKIGVILDCLKAHNII